MENLILLLLLAPAYVEAVRSPLRKKRALMHARRQVETTYKDPLAGPFSKNYMLIEHQDFSAIDLEGYPFSGVLLNRRPTIFEKIASILWYPSGFIAALVPPAYVSGNFSEPNIAPFLLWWAFLIYLLQVRSIAEDSIDAEIKSFEQAALTSKARP